MIAIDVIADLMSAKGWNLYTGSSSDMRLLLASGRAISIEEGRFYHILPAASDDTNERDVFHHLVHARESGQIPRYIADPANAIALKGIFVDDRSTWLVCADGKNSFEIKDPVDVERVIKYDMSNYDVHFFDSIADLRRWVLDHNILPQTPPLLPGQLRWDWVAVDDDPTKLMIYPSDHSRFLFRGQIKRHRPCIPSIARGCEPRAGNLKQIGRNQLEGFVINQIRTFWFVQLLRRTPALVWMRGKNIVAHEVEIAQHYGLPTGYIDLSQSFDVASFFACCKFDRTTKRWSPASEADGSGVMYSIDLARSPCAGRASPICLQPFPRPSEQWAWTFEMTLGDDLDTMPGVKKLVFKHEQEASEDLLRRFNDGLDLFPSDPLALVAERVMEATALPKVIAIDVVEDLRSDPMGLPDSAHVDLMALVRTSCELFDGDPSCGIIDDKLQRLIASTWEIRGEGFRSGAGIGVRLVRTRKDDK